MDPIEILKQLGIDLVKDAADLEPVLGTYDFTIFTRDHAGNGLALKAYEEKVEGQEEPDLVLEGVASSSIKDRHGDTILPSALIDMEKAARNNLTIFLNHSYDVPEDVAGSVKHAEIASSAVDESGNPIFDLAYKVKIDRTNARAVKAHQSMMGGTKLGMSIGARIPEGGAVRNKKTGTLLITHLDLLETSIVGIPANPRSWIDSVAKSIKAGPPAAPETHITLDAQPIVDATAATVAASTAAATAVAAAAAAATPATIVPVDATASAGDASLNTNPPTQDARLSQPENDGTVATPDVIAAATDVLAKTADPAVTDEVDELLREVHNSLAEVTNRLILESEARTAADQRAETAETERDAMRANTESVIAEVANLIEQVGKLPAGRQASFKAIASAAENQAIDWESMGFAPEVVAMLKRSPSE